MLLYVGCEICESIKLRTLFYFLKLCISMYEHHTIPVKNSIKKNLFVQFFKYCYENKILCKNVLYFYYCSIIVFFPHLTFDSYFLHCKLCLFSSYGCIKCTSTPCLKIQSIFIFFCLHHIRHKSFAYLWISAF